MVDVKLIASTDSKPLELASHAALKCYQAEDPKWGKTIDVKNRLFDVGHHTTLQHNFFTFSIEGISVGDITFGMHLAHPFYNSDQRSGRYCAKMFLEPNYGKIESYIKTFWPKTKNVQQKKVMDYVKSGVDIYHKNIETATGVAARFVEEERPHANSEYIENTAKKIAQEQLRSFISVIFPTGFDFTINATVLAAMQRVAWTPAMRSVTKQMVNEVVGRFPELDFMFSYENDDQQDWAMDLPNLNAIRIAKKPLHKVEKVIGDKKVIRPRSGDMHPVDLLHFRPEYMDNSTGEIRTEIMISTATMGQDQRHRTIRRGKPGFVNFSYLPPILQEMKMEKEALDHARRWISVGQDLAPTLAMILAPYGAMVRYKKVASFNALAHEQAKRLCWCAQEEIYHVGQALLLELREMQASPMLLSIFEPPCYRIGKCAEGGRYCGRDISLRKTGDYFPWRKV